MAATLKSEKRLFLNRKEIQHPATEHGNTEREPAATSASADPLGRQPGWLTEDARKVLIIVQLH